MMPAYLATTAGSASFIGSRNSISLNPRIGDRELLKSWAIPLAIWPRASIFWDCRR